MQYDWFVYVIYVMVVCAFFGVIWLKGLIDHNVKKIKHLEKILYILEKKMKEIDGELKRKEMEEK